jgi:hypothetical protein
VNRRQGIICLSPMPSRTSESIAHRNIQYTEQTRTRTVCTSDITGKRKRQCSRASLRSRILAISIHCTQYESEYTLYWKCLLRIMYWVSNSSIPLAFWIRVSWEKLETRKCRMKKKQMYNYFWLSCTNFLFLNRFLQYFSSQICRQFQSYKIF